MKTLKRAQFVSVKGGFDGLTALNDTVTREQTDSGFGRWGGKWRAKRDVAWGRGQDDSTQCKTGNARALGQSGRRGALFA